MESDIVARLRDFCIWKFQVPECGHHQNQGNTRAPIFVPEHISATGKWIPVLVETGYSDGFRYYMFSPEFMLRQAADEIERLRKQIEHHARDRVEYCDAWSKWIEENDGLDIAKWCRAYADAVPYPNPDGPEIVRVIHSRLDARHRMAADEVERLRQERDGFLEGNRQTLRALAEANEIAKWYKRERDEARREVCALTPFVRLETQSAEEYASTRGWDCFKEAR